MWIFEGLLDFFLPKRCWGCDKLGHFVCPDCLGRFKLAKQRCGECSEAAISGWTHPRCRKKLGIDRLIMGWDYKDKNVAKLVKRFKYDFVKQVIPALVGGLQIDEWGDDWILVPVPLHTRKKKWRGFNQAEEIAKELSRKTGVGVADWLVRTKNTKPLAEMESREDRKKEIRDAFAPLSGVSAREWKNKRVILVDDVFTSGATMKEVCKLVKSLGASEVWVWTLAG